ncbi:MAG: helix-turn-helix domain-containing protein [Candidatus Aphodosoma sp.]
MITAIEPTVSATARYSITQAAGILGVNRATLRRYTDSGLIKCGFRRESARKFYLGSEILRFWKAQM